MIRRPPRSTQLQSSAASDVYKRQLLVLEFSKPESNLLSDLYDLYSFNVLPHLGQWIAGDADSYEYLAESIRMHPNQEEFLKLMNVAGFQNTEYQNMTGGIVALHYGDKS